MEELPYHRLLLRQIRRFVPSERIGELTPFFESVSAFYVEAEKERRFLEHTLDVSSKELEEANRSLRQQHASIDKKQQEQIRMQQLALESSATIMLIAERGGTIQYANNAFFRYTGYEKEEVAEKNFQLIFDDALNDPLRVKECLEKVQTGEVWEGEIVGRLKSGELCFEELTITPLIEGEEVTHLVAVKKNINERIRIQAELTQARDDAITAMNQAKEANRAKDTFLSTMSHELRTPLNAIIGFSQILLLKQDTPERIKTFIDKIHISGKNLLSLVNSILDFSKIEAGKMELHISRFVIQELIHEVEILVESMAEKKKVKLSLLLDGEVPVEADRQLLKQVLVNLLSNAIKFSPQGGKVTLLHRKEGDQEIFGIADQGQGIPEDKIDTLFDPFTQIREHQNESIKGTGLGLTIVKKIVELHGGRLWVESVVREGSCFYFSLPSGGEAYAPRGAIG